MLQLQVWYLVKGLNRTFPLIQLRDAKRDTTLDTCALTSFFSVICKMFLKEKEFKFMHLVFLSFFWYP